MIWIGFCNQEKLMLQIIDRKLNCEKYCKMLDISRKDFFHNKNPYEYIFQQDNAPCHRAKNTINWVETNRITVMDWPSLSPDLNPVENVWSELSKMIYCDGKQYSTISELKTAILIAWATISNDLLKSYVLGMQKRMLDVLKVKRDKIDKLSF